MQTRLLLAGAATVAIVATGVFVAGSTLHGQASVKTPVDTVPDAATLTREINTAVREALGQAGIRTAALNIDLERTIQEATQVARDAVKDVDVRVLVGDALQDLPDMAHLELLGGRPRLGVSTRDVTAEEASAAGLSGITGAYISDVQAESAAGKAGLLARDIIVSVDGETIRSARQLARVIGESPDGRALQIGYVRGTTKNTVSVTPEVRGPRTMTWAPGSPLGPGGEGPVVRKFERRMGPEFFFHQGPGGMRVWSGRSRLGVMAQSLSDQLATYFGVKDGVLVTQVTENSAAAKAGIKAGDVITAVDGKPVKDVGDIIDHLQGVESGKTVPVEITRDKQAQTISVTLETPSSTFRERSVTRRQRFTA